MNATQAAVLRGGSRLVRVLASTGLATTLVVLAVSVWLRVNTSMDPAGNAVSSLGAAPEHALRMLHRVAASATGLVAVALTVLVSRARPWRSGQLTGLAWVVAMTLALALAGRYTPGYRLPGITIVNVAAGIALATGFLWLRLSTPGTHPGDAPPGRAPRGIAVAALAVAFAHSALGAAASAHTMHRAPISLEPWHVGLGLAVAAFCMAAAARAAHVERRGRIVLAGLVVAQLVTGFRVAAMGEAAAPLAAWWHVATAAALVLVLAYLVRTPQAPPRRASS